MSFLSWAGVRILPKRSLCRQRSSWLDIRLSQVKLGYDGLILIIQAIEFDRLPLNCLQAKNHVIWRLLAYRSSSQNRYHTMLFKLFVFNHFMHRLWVSKIYDFCSKHFKNSRWHSTTQIINVGPPSSDFIWLNLTWDLVHWILIHLHTHPNTHTPLLSFDGHVRVISFDTRL